MTLWTAVASVFVPYVLFRMPVWLGSSEFVTFITYWGSRANPVVRLPTYLLGMQLGAATLQNKRTPSETSFNWAALADFLSVFVFAGWVAFTFFAPYVFPYHSPMMGVMRDVHDRAIDIHLRGFCEFFSTPVFALWFRALSETNQSWSYKLL